MERVGFTQSIFLGCWWSYIGVKLGHTGRSPCNGGWGSYSSFNGGGEGNTVHSLGRVIQSTVYLLVGKLGPTGHSPCNGEGEVHTVHLLGWWR